MTKKFVRAVGDISFGALLTEGFEQGAGGARFGRKSLVRDWRKNFFSESLEKEKR